MLYFFITTMHELVCCLREIPRQERDPCLAESKLESADFFGVIASCARQM